MPDYGTRDYERITGLQVEHYMHGYRVWAPGVNPWTTTGSPVKTFKTVRGVQNYLKKEAEKVLASQTEATSTRGAGATSTSRT